MISCFEPWVDSQTKILVVGTMPSVASLDAGMYYAHPQNRFWNYMQNILNAGQCGRTATERRTLLLKNKIGLWDALALCEREGSLDSEIKNAVPNDFSKLKQVKYFLFNGQSAFKYFKKYNSTLLKPNGDNYVVLPSTSPANASIKESVKFEKWKTAIQKALLLADI